MGSRTCSVDICDGSVSKRGWCNRHYLRWYRHGHPLAGGTERVLDDSPDRFWSKVDKSGDCWLWTAATNSRGYGVTWSDGALGLAHRRSYTDAKGPIPDGMELDHLCRTPVCVNPDHLEPVSHRVNVARGMAGKGQPRSSGRFAKV